MDKVFALSLNSLQQDMQCMDKIALNLVNAATPGYRREVAAVRPFTGIVDQLGQQASQPEGGGLEVRLDPRAGTLKSTGQPLDLAITGDGFFEVRTEHGLAYTRQGDFRLDGQGRLVTAQGYPVMGKRGEIILHMADPLVDADGAIRDPRAASDDSSSPALAQLRLVRFEHPESLSPMGDGLVSQAGGAHELPEAHGQVKQGALENSNVSSVSEMISMMSTLRHFESVHRMTQGYNDMIGTAIHRLGDLS